MTQTYMNDHHYVAFMHTSTCITLRPDLVHMIKVLKITYGRSWKMWGMNWIGPGEAVGLRISKTSELIYVRLIAGRYRWNVIGQLHSSLS
jgi:hypothetical protein